MGAVRDADANRRVSWGLPLTDPCRLPYRRPEYIRSIQGDLLYGLDTDPIRHVSVGHSRFTDVTSTDNVVEHVEDLTFTDVTVNGVPL